MRNYKKVSECPPKLKKVIARLNLLPPDLDEFLEKLSEMQKQEISEDKIRDFYLNYAQNLDVELQKYLRSRNGNLWFYGEMILHELNRDSQVIYLLSLYARQERIAKKRERDWENSKRKLSIIIDGKPQKPNFRPSALAGYININSELFREFINLGGSKGLFTRPEVNEKGFVELRHSGLSEAFQTEKIKVDRIRICPICRDIFWAKKINSKTCGEQVCIDGLQNYKKKYKTKKEEKTNNSTKKEEKTNNSFEISDQRQAERKEFLSKDFSKTE